MGAYSEALAALATLLINLTDSLVEAAINGIVFAVDAVAAWLLELRNKALRDIVSWLEVSYRGLKLLLIIVVSGLVLVGVEAVLWLASKRIALAAALAALRSLDSVTKLRMSVTILQGVWAIVVELDDRFRALEDAFVEFGTAFDETFGVATGFIASAAMAYRSYLKALHATIGLPEEQSRLQWFDTVTQWLDKANRSFRTYARHPGKLFGLLESLYLGLTYEDASGTQRASLETIADLLERAEGFTEGLGDVREAIDGIIESFPTEIKDVLAAQIGPYLKVYDDSIARVVKRLDGIFGEVRGEIEGLIALAATPLEERLARLEPWQRKLLELLGYDMPTPKLQVDYLRALSGLQGHDNEVDLIVEGIVRESIQKTIADGREALRAPLELPDTSMGRPPVYIYEPGAGPAWYAEDGEDGAGGGVFWWVEE